MVAVAGALALILSLLSGSYPVAAAERILSFESAITVHPDSTMTVEERIRVIAEGKEIKRGIYRDFPTKYRDRAGNTYAVGFDVIRVQRDGKSEPYHVKEMSNGKRVYVGHKDLHLSPGVYDYTLVYRTSRQLGFFRDHDELYWNVTGNGWDFVIEKASATVVLPPGARGKILSRDGYTGPQGATLKDFKTSLDNSGNIAFVTTKPLMPREGLTIVVSWPKGFVTEPGEAERAAYFVRDNRGVVLGFFGSFILIVYYLITWVRVGRDPEEGTIIPLFTPPSGLSPAAVRFISRMGFDHRAFASAIIEMAVKGAISIREEGDSYVVIKGKGDDKSLTPDERQILSKLFESGSTVELEQKNHQIIRNAIKAVKDSLSLSFEKVYFLTNRWYFIGGLILSVIVIAPMVFYGGRSELSVFMGLWLTIWTTGVIFLLSQVLARWRAALYGRWHRIASFGGALFLTLFSLPFIGGEIFGIVILAKETSPWVFVNLVSVALINALFYHLLKAPTRAGRSILDKIEGFKMFLSVTEKDRLTIMNPPEKTPGLFEKYLPYALALDVEQAWSEQFSDVLMRAGEGGQTYHPGWYSGSSWNSSDIGGFAGSLGSSFSGAIASSSTAPGSSSGGGGGSSGGGGGGGGGGGW